MDRTQLRYFLDCLVGWRTVGATTEDEITVPMCAEMRGFITGRLGDLTPTTGYRALQDAPQAKAMAALLREAADALDTFSVAKAA